MQLATAQERGLSTCFHVDVQNDEDLDRAIDWMLEHLGAGPVGLGWDLATTEKQTSNPSAFAVMEQDGVNYLARLILTWKTADPDIAERYSGRVIDAVAKRCGGGRAKALHIDATNERYFASTMQKKFRAKLPVVCVVGSESVTKPGYEPMTMKQYLGGLLVGELDDNHLTLPPAIYIKEDFRLEKKDRGQFVCTPDVQGRHGDTFDACKLALNAIKGCPPPVIPAAFPNSRTSRVLQARRNREVLA